MDKEILLDRIDKKKIAIAKIEKRIQKWENKKNLEDFWKEEGWCHQPQYETKKQYEERHYSNYLDYCNDEIHIATIDLEDAKNTLKKYEDQLKSINEFNHSVKIQVLVDFLTDWGEKSYNWYINNANEYIRLKNNYNVNYDKYLQEYKNRYNIEELHTIQKYRIEEIFKSEYYASINTFTKSLVGFHNKIDEDTLKKEIEREKVRKYKDLVARISNCVGEIKDVKNLSIGDQNGEINGFVIGSKGKAEVETISAGGYNIQCFHYRVLVKKIK